jgi:hypothetical protein
MSRISPKTRCFGPLTMVEGLGGGGVVGFGWKLEVDLLDRDIG